LFTYLGIKRNLTWLFYQNDLAWYVCLKLGSKRPRSFCFWYRM